MKKTLNKPTQIEAVSNPFSEIKTPSSDLEIHNTSLSNSSLPNSNDIKNASPGKFPSLVTAVRSFENFCDALRLVHDQYVARGYMNPHPSGMRLTKYLLHPKAKVFSNISNGTTIGTISVIPNTTEFNLPCYQDYMENFSAVLSSGAKIAELSMFATKDAKSGLRNSNMSELMRVAYHSAASQADYIASVVNPRYVRIYERFFHFQKVAQEGRPCSTVSETLGVPMILDIAAVSKMKLNRRSQLDTIIKQPLPPNHFSSGHQLTSDQVSFLLKKFPEVSNGLTNREREFIDLVYDNAHTKALHD